MITIEKILKEAVGRLKTKVSTPLLDAQVILCHILKVDRLYLIVNKDRVLTHKQILEYKGLIQKRACGVPVQYITGIQEFMGLEFYLEEGVLIPRPDTEILIEKILDSIDENDKYNIIDIGTGSGAISVSLAKYVQNSYIYSIDISQKALDIARINAVKNNVLPKINFLKGSLFEPLENINLLERIDILVSNPPYIPTEDIDTLQIEVSKFEPRLALDGGEDGLDFYRVIIDKAPVYLKNNGLIALEVGHDQAQRVVKLMEEKKKYVDIEITKDLAGIERVVSARIKL
ncbi:peptide chain release factor N(5)-glutamine methyltransferase [Maledivibacter halophilus]|uniref:Release factor glutamine methyltransferase n=1 Tax=Maledivibacter halophilus TaxID=36842 RepID=A0A1T5JZA9_9FIRM|nr:peptide chain release factor N(5)-glutamine methyltransferase [Maledivibacter halophilus]SKC56569.1 release factor glutamine methyltransferase [Maledivibacter halophilus]